MGFTFAYLDMSLKRRLPAGIVVSLTLSFFTGCGLKDRVRSFFQEDDRNPIVVRVGDKAYTKVELDHYFDNRLSEFRDPTDADKIKSNLLESFIEDKLLLSQADRLNVQANPQMLKSMMENMTATDEERAAPTDPSKESELRRTLTESLKMQQYLHDHLLNEISITDQECEAYYLAHIGEYVRNDLAHVREILVDNAEVAQKVVDSLAKKKNKNFAELARVYSKAPSASDGGDLGVFQRGDLPDDFEKAIFPLAPGTVSKVVRTKYGYHIFMVEEKIAAHQQKFWEVRDQIRERLQQEQERELINKELASLASRTVIRVDRDKLDFKYIGTRYPAN
jgi:parvulin-like peptidyl-prolyl isomerase